MLDQFPSLGPDDVFEDRITKTDSCWLWNGTTNEYGYGIFLMPGERPVRAHRYSYEHFKGPIPDGKIVMHICDNPPCVNPAHLRLGDRDENNKDSVRKARNAFGERNGRSRLTQAQIDEIKSSGLTQQQLAKIYKCHQSHISRILNGNVRSKG